MRRCLREWLLLGTLSYLVAGCAFDVVHVKQAPTSFTSGEGKAFKLDREVKVNLGTGFPTTLKAGTVWTLAGSSQHGDVYRTRDQVVKVEASNIYEAFIVVADESLVGFYLPVEETFAPIKKPIELQIDSLDP